MHDLYSNFTLMCVSVLKIYTIIQNRAHKRTNTRNWGLRNLPIYDVPPHLQLVKHGYQFALLDLRNVCVRREAWFQSANGRVLHQRSNQSIFCRTSHYASTCCCYYKDHNVGWNILFRVPLGIRDSIFLVHADSLPRVHRPVVR